MIHHAGRRLIWMAAAGAMLLSPGLLLAQEGEEEDPVELEELEGEQECALQGGDLAANAEDLINQAAEAEDSASAVGLYRQALETIQQAMEDNPEGPANFWLAGRAQIGLGNLAEADSMLTRFEEIEPGCASYSQDARFQAWVERYNRGIRQYQQGNEMAALESFEDANLIHDDPRSLNNAALLQQREGNVERAEELYRRSVQVAEDEEQLRSATVNLAELLKSEGQTEEANEIYQNYISEYPDAVLPRINYAVDLMNTGQQDSARAIFSDLLARDDLTFSEWRDVGTGLLQVQAFEDARTALENAREEVPYDKAVMQNYLAATAGAGDLQAAAAVGDTLVDWYPYETDTYRTMAQILDRLGEPQRVQQILAAQQQLALQFERTELRETGENSYEVMGQVVGQGSGTTVTVPFEFLGPEGDVVASSDASVEVPADGQLGEFHVQVNAEEPVVGFRYGTVQSGSS